MTDRSKVSRSIPIRAVAMLLVVASPLVLASPGVAAAAPAHFTYEMCDPAVPVPGGNVPQVSSYSDPPDLTAIPVQSCATGGTIGITQVEGTSTQTAPALLLTIPPTPGGFVESETVSAEAHDLHSNQIFVDGENWLVADAGDQVRTLPLVGVFQEPGLEPGYGGLTVALLCTTGAPCEQGASVGVHFIAVHEVDPTPPNAPSLTGTILENGVLHGHQTLAAETADVGGGVASLELLVNGVSAATPVAGACSVVSVTNPSYRGAGLAATSPTPCPPTLSGAWTLDTSAPPFQEGTNTFQVCASDFSTFGPPNRTCSPTQAVEVNNSCAASTVGGGQDLSAEFPRTGSETTTVDFGEEAEIKGTLTGEGGNPVSGATICVEAEPQTTDTEPELVGTTTTDSAGSFDWKVPSGPNRHLMVGYRHDSFQVDRSLTVGTRARPTIRLSAGRVHAGDRIGITGKLPGPSRTEHVLVLQASSLHGKNWLTFRRVTTGPKGGYRATYRFGRTTSTITYRLRALVPRQAGYPYEPGASKPARVKVRRPRRIRPGHERRPASDSQLNSARR